MALITLQILIHCYSQKRYFGFLAGDCANCLAEQAEGPCSSPQLQLRNWALERPCHLSQDHLAEEEVEPDFQSQIHRPISAFQV